MKNPLQGANTQMADPNEAPTVPQAAATVLLVRDSKDEGIEVFLVERASKAKLGQTRNPASASGALDLSGLS